MLNMLKKNDLKKDPQDKVIMSQVTTVKKQ